MTATEAMEVVVVPRRRRLWLIGLALFVVIYISVLALYAISGRSHTVGDDVLIPANGVRVTVYAQSMNAAQNQLNAIFTIDGGAGITEPGGSGLTEDVIVVFSPVTGTQQINFAQREVPGTLPLQILVDGDIEFWPFDRYQTEGLSIEAFKVVGGVREEVPMSVRIDGHIQGWKFTADSVRGTPAGGLGPQTFDLNLARSGGALTFAAVMMCIFLVMPALSVFVATATYRRKRKVEPTFASWIAAMLFATFSLRAFLPGAPPVGSWVDAVVVLWVAAALVGSLAVFIVAWWQTSRPPS
jgi:hypothetical protein